MKNKVSEIVFYAPRRLSNRELVEITGGTPSSAIEQDENDKHYQNALSLYEMILDNVDETAENVCRHTEKKEYLDSARIGCLKAWCDRLVHKLPDWEIEYMKDLMKIDVDKQ